jgi:hypothetical protein
MKRIHLFEFVDQFAAAGRDGIATMPRVCPVDGKEEATR